VIKRLNSPADIMLRVGVVAAAAIVAAAESPPFYEIGFGIADATGPISDVLMMGMANPAQVNAGLHQRLWARTLAAHDPATGKRFALVSLDAGMGGIVLKNRVVKGLAERLPGLYTDENVAISGTHTHSGPSGFLQDTIFQFAGSGWQPHTIAAMVEGVVESVVAAHRNLAPARASVAVGELENASINRSPSAYLLNPPAERALYTGDTDLNMTVLRVDSADGTAASKSLGMFAWFAVHPTSMNNTNKLVSGDNKGYASYMMERAMNGETAAGAPPGAGPFVAAFGSTNLGDVSPNILGPHCRDTGLPCDFDHSTCNNRTEQCSAVGPGRDMFESTQIIGQRQVDAATRLFAGPTSDLGGGVDYKHAYVKMPGLAVSDPSGAPVGTLCSAAMGDAFAAGTIDGPGEFDFTQGANSSNPFWHWIVDLIHKPTPAEMRCQAPKGILLPTGDINVPYPWGPDTLPVQLLRLGQLIIVVAPTELTTMAGRRLRNHLRAQLVADKVISAAEGTVVISGLANGYADYTVTFEEYQQQRYEGGSTIFGPHQLNAYIQQFSKLATAMAANTSAVSDPPPVDFSDRLSNSTSLSEDHLPSGAKHFGDILQDVQSAYAAGGGAIVTAKFAGANPVNNLRPTGSFFEVQRCTTAAAANCTQWATVAVDGDWETRIHIIKSKVDLINSVRTWQVEWHVPPQTTGTFRLLHRGSSYSKPLFGTGKLTPYEGTTSTFSVQKA